MNEEIWFDIAGINPEPWTSPEVSVGRKDGKMFPTVYKSPGLAAYQNAIREDLDYWHPNFPPIVGEVTLNFYFWRQLHDYAGDRGKVRKHQADATNLQKALEDALQGILFANDRDVQTIKSQIMSQDSYTEPLILIQLIPGATYTREAQVRADKLLILARDRHPAAASDRPGVEDLF